MKRFRLAMSAMLLLLTALLFTGTPSPASVRPPIQKIHLGDTVKGVLTSPSEEAVYQIDTPFLGYLQLSLQVPNNCDLHVYDQSEHELGSITSTNQSTKKMTLYISSTTFSVYLKLKPSATNIANPAPYTLTATQSIH